MNSVYRFSLAGLTVLSLAVWQISGNAAAGLDKSKPVDVYVNPLEYRQQTAPLVIGQPAPHLPVTRWVRGPVPEMFVPGKVTVVEFWATWCGPCRKSIPHLTRLQHRYRNSGVEIIGVAAAEQDDGGALGEFLARQGDAINYPIAYVNDSDVYDRWMRAGRTFGLPWVFIVDRQGRIAWWGQPFYGDFEPTLQAVVEGVHDLSALRAHWREGSKTAHKGWTLARELDRARHRRDWQTALGLIEQLATVDVERYWFEQTQKLEILLFELNRIEQGLDYARRLFQSPLAKNPHGMMAVGELLMDRNLSSEFLALSQRAIAIADSLTLGRNAAVKSVAARLACIRNDLAGGIALAREVLILAESAVAEQLLEDITESCGDIKDRLKAGGNIGGYRNLSW